MLKVRLIPVLLLKDGLLVRSETFSLHQFIGDPVHEVVRYNDWSVDELIYLDISRAGTYERGRNDVKVKQTTNVLELLPQIASACFVPLTFGGRIRSLEDMRVRLALGADKITINTAAVDTPDLITRGAELFGAQCIVVCIDAVRKKDGSYEVMIDGGKRPTGHDVVAWSREVEHRGAGEILVQSVDRDGLGVGFDHELVRLVAQSVSIPVIALGGAGRYEHFADVIRNTGASAVAAANIFHFKEMADRFIKREMKKSGIEIRES